MRGTGGWRGDKETQLERNYQEQARGSEVGRVREKKAYHTQQANKQRKNKKKHGLKRGKVPGIAFHFTPFSNNAAVFHIRRQATCNLMKGSNIRTCLFSIASCLTGEAVLQGSWKGEKRKKNQEAKQLV